MKKNSARCEERRRRLEDDEGDGDGEREAVVQSISHRSKHAHTNADSHSYFVFSPVCGGLYFLENNVRRSLIFRRNKRKICLN